MNRVSRVPAERLDGLISVALGTAWTLILLFAAVALVRPWPDVVLRIDFSSFWMAASLLRDGAGASLFDPGTQYAFEMGLRQRLAVTDLVRNDVGFNPYPNLPPLALLYVPLTFLPVSWAYLLWWGLSLATFAAAVVVLLRGHPFGRTKGVLMLSFVGVTTSLFEGQPYGLFLLDLTLGLLMLRSGHPLAGGLLLGFLWLKPQYAVVFPVVFLLKGRWRELAGMAVSGVVVAGVSLLLVGVDGIFAYLRLLEGIGGLHYRWVDPWAMVNWRGALLNLWPNVPEVPGSILVLVLGTATILASLTVWKGEWKPYSRRFPYQIMVALLATLLASPHSHIHGAVLLLAPLGLALQGSKADEWKPRFWTGLLLAGYALSFAVWPFGMPRWVMGPYFLVFMAFLIVRCARDPEPAPEPAPVPS